MSFTLTVRAIVMAGVLWPILPATALPIAPLSLDYSPAAMSSLVQPARIAAVEPPPVRPQVDRAFVLASAPVLSVVSPTEATRARLPRPSDPVLHSLEEQIIAGNRLIADMMARVVAMEREVAEMRARVQSLPGASAQRPAPADAASLAPAAQPRPTAAAEYDAAERRKRQQALIDNGLLLLAAGVLLLLAGVAYWTWGRPALKDRLREARVVRASQPAAA